MVNVSCGGHAVHHVGSLVSVFHLFVVREPCRGHYHFGCGQRVMSWSVCHVVVSLSCRGHALCHGGSLVSVLHRFAMSESPAVVSV